MCAEKDEKELRRRKNFPFTHPAFFYYCAPRPPLIISAPQGFLNLLGEGGDSDPNFQLHLGIETPFNTRDKSTFSPGSLATLPPSLRTPVPRNKVWKCIIIMPLELKELCWRKGMRERAAAAKVLRATPYFLDLPLKFLTL